MDKSLPSLAGDLLWRKSKTTVGNTDPVLVAKADSRRWSLRFKALTTTIVVGPESVNLMAGGDWFSIGAGTWSDLFLYKEYLTMIQGEWYALAGGVGGTLVTVESYLKG